LELVPQLVTKLRVEYTVLPLADSSRMLTAVPPA